MNYRKENQYRLMSRPHTHARAGTHTQPINTKRSETPLNCGQLRLRSPWNIYRKKERRKKKADCESPPSSFSMSLSALLLMFIVVVFRSSRSHQHFFASIYRSVIRIFFLFFFICHQDTESKPIDRHINSAPYNMLMITLSYFFDSREAIFKYTKCIVSVFICCINIINIRCSRNRPYTDRPEPDHPAIRCKWHPYSFLFEVIYS